MLHLTIWMNMPSFHQGDLFKALSQSDEVDLEVIFAKDLTPDRLDLGWEKALDGYSYRFLDERNKHADAVRLARSQRSRLHLVNGFWAEQAFAAALVTLAICGSRYVIHSEGSDPHQRRSLQKRALRNGIARLFAPRGVGALPVSRFAFEFFRSVGVPDERIYPFGYFRALPSAEKLDQPRIDSRIEVIFAGQFVRRKGIDLLIDAMTPLFDQHPKLSLVLIGKGELLDDLKTQAAAHGVLDRLAFEGVISANQIPGRVAKADVLVLPSRWDGWGMVVNEALSVGVPVIVSDLCGAAELVRDGINGYVFRSEDTADLNRCLGSFLDQRSDWPRFRANALATGKMISVGEVAPYLIACLKHMIGLREERPYPPWVEADKLQAVNV